MPTVKERISDLASNILGDTDFFLIDIDMRGGKTPKVFVYVDGKERNVTLDECADISNELGFLIDAYELFNDSYRLNVSSPGLSRPLIDKRQYPKNKDRKVKVTYTDDAETEPEQYEKVVEGTLTDVFEDEITIKTKGERLALPFDKIKETKVIPSLKK